MFCCFFNCQTAWICICSAALLLIFGPVNDLKSSVAALHCTYRWCYTTRALLHLRTFREDSALSVLDSKLNGRFPFSCFPQMSSRLKINVIWLVWWWGIKKKQKQKVVLLRQKSPAALPPGRQQKRFARAKPSWACKSNIPIAPSSPTRQIRSGSTGPSPAAAKVKREIQFCKVYT